MLKAPADSAGQLRGVGVTPGAMAADTAAQEAEAPTGMEAATPEGGAVGADATAAPAAPAP